MNLSTGAGIALIGAFVLLFVGALLSPSGIYQEPDVSLRMETIAANESRWIASQAVSGLALAAAPIGYLLLALHFRPSSSDLYFYLAAGLFITGAVLAEIYLVRYTIDPAPAWGSTPMILTMGVSLMIAGVLALGFGLLQVSPPVWLEYIVIAAAALSALAFLALGVGAFMVLTMLYLVGMIVGVAVLRA